MRVYHVQAVHAIGDGLWESNNQGVRTQPLRCTVRCGAWPSLGWQARACAHGGSEYAMPAWLQMCCLSPALTRCLPRLCMSVLRRSCSST